MIEDYALNRYYIIRVGVNYYKLARFRITTRFSKGFDPLANEMKHPLPGWNKVNLSLATIILFGFIIVLIYRL